MDIISIIGLIVNILVAIGTIVVAILAIWGDWFRDRFASPQLAIRLRETRGNLTSMGGRKVMYYHLIVENKRQWALAKGVQIMLDGIWRRAADGSFKPETLAASLPLTWAYPQFNPVNPSIRDRMICDLGYIIEGESHFKPSLYIYPNNFKGFVGANEAVRLILKIQAENFTSKRPHVIEVHWDGQWSTDMEQMQNHLVVKDLGSSPS